MSGIPFARSFAFARQAEPFIWFREPVTFLAVSSVQHGIGTRPL